MTRTLSQRLWARGLNPYAVRRESANYARALCNSRSWQVLGFWSHAVIAGKCAASYALRMKRYEMARDNSDARWRGLGGRIP